MEDVRQQKVYEILARIGRGGFGDVYHARMRGPQGFVQDVALKIARDDKADPSMLARFRDEARILGLLSDRAVVTALPPAQLSGRWVMIMEYVNGATAHRLLKRWVFPPRAALELVAEIARVLDKAQRTHGPDGTPLGLIHRDLKPGNLMITDEGHVKLLDFGIAWAEFDNREALTSATLGGTPGYIAPERLRGIDGPMGDVYSLGVLLHVLLTGQSATRVDVDELSVTEGTEHAELLAYARRMRAPMPDDRPTAKEVEASCRTWAQRIEGPDLRAFAMQRVPLARMREDDGLVGAVLTETMMLPSGATILPPRTRFPRWLMAVVGIAVGVTLLTVPAALALAMYATFGGSSGSAQGVSVQPEEAAARVQPPRAQLGEDDGTADLGPSVELVPPEPAPAPAPRRASRTAPKSKHRAAPKPVPVPVAAPDAVVEQPAPTTPAPHLVAVSFLSDPRGAEVVLDGVAIGHTPLRNHPTTAGDHELLFRRGDHHAVLGVRIGGRHSPKEFKWTAAQGVVAQ